MRPLLALVVFLCVPACGADEEILRRALALYDSRDPEPCEADTSPAHLYWESILNFLGLAVDYHDVNRRPLPDAERYRAIVAWYGDDAMFMPEEYCRWLAQAMRRGVRVVLIDNLGAERHLDGLPTDAAALEEVYQELGLREDKSAGVSGDPLKVETRDLRADCFYRETRTPFDRVFYRRFIPVRSDVECWRAVRRKDLPDSEGAAVMVCSRGGWVLDNCFMLRILRAPFFSPRWDLDPERFLRAALTWKDVPMPDVTAAFGCRAAFCHIDSDGIDNLTIDVPGGRRPAGQVIYEEVLRRYPIPATVGIIAGQIDPASDARGYAWDGDAAMLADFEERAAQPRLEAKAQLQALAARVFALPHVQIGCHGYAHPLIWRKGTLALRITGYAFSEEQETVGAMAVIARHIAPPGKEVELMQWTGDCRPSANAVRLVQAKGIANINGGNARYDRAYRSLYHILPLTRPVDGVRQVYAPAPNENLFTNLWTENFGGYVRVLETFQRTAGPPYLLPVNVYYHFYIAERLAGLRSLHEVYAWCLRQPLCWLHASEYAKAVDGFHCMRIGRRADGGFWVENFGACRTLRLEQSKQKIDMAKSRGVLGYCQQGNILYVTLAPGERAELALASSPNRVPCLKRSTAVLRNVRWSEAGFRAEARLYAEGFIEVQGFTPDAVLQGQVGAQARTLRANAEGVVCLPLPAGRGEWREIRIGH